MAIYHFSGTVISRSQGRSAVACAAYRAGEKLHDDRYEKTHDYTQKDDVEHREILLPENAPEHLKYRETLWNEVERCEKRKDAQLAREFNFALPRELTLEQNTALAREFVQDEFVKRGMIADLAIHNDKNEQGEFQPHAHVMLTLREVTLEGFGQKVREWNAKENILEWREAWAACANKHLFLNGHDLKIDHRSLNEQGIGLEPQHKIGAVVAQERLARLADHQRIARENGEKLLAEPEVALMAITRQQSTFTHHDLARFVNRHTVDNEQFQAVYHRVLNCPEMVLLGQDDKAQARYTTREMLTVESDMLQHTQTLTARESHRVVSTLKEALLPRYSLTQEQTLAFEHLISPGDLKNVVGYAGSGKSYVLGAAREIWEGEGYEVRGVALSGIAAENLEGSSGIPSRTIASCLYAWEKGEQRLTPQSILVVDEAGMVGSRQLNRLLGEAAEQKAKVVLVGDPYQLQAIEAGAAFRAVSEHSPTVVLTDIQRQTFNWQREATRELATGQTQAALERYAEHDHIHAFDTQALAQRQLIQLWNDARISQPDKTQIILAFTRKEVAELNQLAREQRQQQGELGVEHSFSTARGTRSFSENDRIYFLKNDRELGVKNGTLGTIERIEGNELRMRLDSQQGEPSSIQFDLERYNHLDHGYAATVHKAQGVTVDRAYLLASKHMDGHTTYVGLSRHRESVDVFYSHEMFAHKQAFLSTLSRERTKDVTLDYTQDTFSRQRGFEKENRESISPPLEKAEPSINEQQRYEALLKESAQQYDRLNAEHTSRSDEFSEFKRQFEQAHPIQAQSLRDEIMPRFERLALEAQKTFSLLEKACEHSRTPQVAREQLETYATRVANSPQVMQYLKDTNKELSQKIENLSQKTLERTRDIERGFER